MARVTAASSRASGASVPPRRGAQADGGRPRAGLRWATTLGAAQTLDRGVCCVQPAAGGRGLAREWTTEERPQKGRSVRPASAPEGHDSDGVDASGEPTKSCTGGFTFIAEEAIVLEFCGVGRL